jgi:hypothetical protein
MRVETAMMASINGAVCSLPDQRSWIETPCLGVSVLTGQAQLPLEMSPLGAVAMRPARVMRLSRLGAHSRPRSSASFAWTPRRSFCPRGCGLRQRDCASDRPRAPTSRTRHQTRASRRLLNVTGSMSGPVTTKCSRTRRMVRTVNATLPGPSLPPPRASPLAHPGSSS